MTTRTRTLATITASAAALTLSGCTGTTEENPLTTSPTSTSAAPSSTTTSASTTATTSTTTAAPSGVDQAEHAVVEFYKQMDQLGQGKLDINKVTTWSRIDQDYKDTQTKWTKSLGDQVLGQKILQVGTTTVSDISGKEADKPKSTAKFDAAYSVVACVDRSQLTYEKNGNPVDYNAGVATKTLVTHLVIENKGLFRVVRDEPGASC